jgi:hypothetical protein
MARTSKKGDTMQRKILILTAALGLIGLGVAFARLDERAHAPRPETPPELAGCPRVGGALTHDGWAVCYACDGETPVCLLIGGGR